MATTVVQFTPPLTHCCALFLQVTALKIELQTMTMSAWRVLWTHLQAAAVYLGTGWLLGVRAVKLLPWFVSLSIEQRIAFSVVPPAGLTWISVMSRQRMEYINGAAELRIQRLEAYADHKESCEVGSCPILIPCCT